MPGSKTVASSIKQNVNPTLEVALNTRLVYEKNRANKSTFGVIHPNKTNKEFHSVDQKYKTLKAA